MVSTLQSSPTFTRDEPPALHIYIYPPRFSPWKKVNYLTFMRTLTRLLFKSLMLAAVSASIGSLAQAGPFVTWKQDTVEGFDLEFGGGLVADGSNWDTGSVDFFSPSGLWEFRTMGAFLSPFPGGTSCRMMVNAATGDFLASAPYSFHTMGGYGDTASVGESSGNFLRGEGVGFSNSGLVTLLFPTGTPEDVSTWTYDIHATFGTILPPSSTPIPEPSTYALCASVLLGVIIFRRRR